MEQPRPKKRRRRRKKETNDSAIGTFSISVDAARGDDEATTPGSFASVRSRAEALGGTYSATVHRNVHVLLASAGAVERKTQRVRKAAKLGVAVVDAGPFLDACEAGAFDAEAHALQRHEQRGGARAHASHPASLSPTTGALSSSFET